MVSWELFLGHRIQGPWAQDIVMVASTGKPAAEENANRELDALDHEGSQGGNVKKTKNEHTEEGKHQGEADLKIKKQKLQEKKQLESQAAQHKKQAGLDI